MHSSRLLIRLGFVAICSLAVGIDSTTAQPQQYTLAPGSTLALDGSTLLGGFTCRSDRSTGIAGVQASTSAAPQVTAMLAAPVASFDCGNGAMNRDLVRAMRGDEHPDIRFVLDRVAPLDPATGEGWRPVHAWGTLSMAGIERPVRIDAEALLEGSQTRLRGHHRLRMSDFGIRPPSGPLGLVRARDEVTVRFELIVRR